MLYFQHKYTVLFFECPSNETKIWQSRTLREVVVSKRSIQIARKIQLFLAIFTFGAYNMNYFISKWVQK